MGYSSLSYTVMAQNKLCRLTTKVTKLPMDPPTYSQVKYIKGVLKFSYTAMTQKQVCRITTKVTTLPTDMPTTLTTALPNVCVQASKCRTNITKSPRLAPRSRPIITGDNTHLDLPVDSQLHHAAPHASPPHAQMEETVNNPRLLR